MKKVLLLLMLCVVISAMANPENFTNDNDCLQLDAPAEAATSWYSWKSEVVESAEWSLTFTLDFAPSTSNYFRWHLSSDSMNITRKTAGFYVQTGKQVSLVKITNGKKQQILTADDVILSAGSYRMTVLYKSGDWHLSLYRQTDSLLWQADGFALAGNPSCYAGIECVYTKTRSKGFRFCAVESSGEPFVEPWKPACGDVLLNEVLTWPAKCGVDYVELYNASDSTVSLDCLQIGNGKTKVALPARPLLSGGYALLATDTKWVADTYPHHDSGAFVTMPKMPAFAADSGEVWLYDNDGNVLDSLFYNGMMHNQRLETTQGVALERLQGTAEWASAGMAYQYGSPGLPNPMVVIGLENQSAGIRLLSTQVSPNGDGVDDRLGICLSFAQDVYVHLTVCSPYGQTLSTLIDGAAANGCQYVWWDAVDARGRAVAPGIYLVVSEVEGDGFHQRRKIPFVVVP